MSELSLGSTKEKKGGRLLPLLIVLLVVAATIAALALSGVFGEAAVETQAPDTPQGLWESQDVNSYRYTLQVGCFCLVEMTRPVTIEVLNGEVASITYVDVGTA